MNVLQMKEYLDKLGVPKSYYSINGILSSNIYVLNQVHNMWEYFYFDERGNRNDYKKFDNESNACDYFLKQLKIKMKY